MAVVLVSFMILLAQPRLVALFRVRRDGHYRVTWNERGEKVKKKQKTKQNSLFRKRSYNLHLQSLNIGRNDN